MSGYVEGRGVGAVGSTIIGQVPAPASGRGVVVLLGRATGVNLNAVAATTIFTTPASGFTRCEVTIITVDNFSGTPTTNAVSFGASATPTDWLGATVLSGTAGVGKALRLFPQINVGYAEYGTNIAFVANVTIGGAAITCDIDVYGVYE